MPTGGLYGRLQSRGFPSSAVAGQTGAGARESQGHPADPIHGQAAAAAGQWSTLPGFQPEPPPGPAVELLEGTWGLPGQVYEPDQTPGYGPGELRTHAAPVPGWAGSYDDPELAVVHDNSVEIHSVDFGALDKRRRSPSSSPEPNYDQWRSNDPGSSNLEHVGGQLRFMGGYDADQGYGGGADGPGGTNSYGFGAGHRERTTPTDPQPMVYLDPAERIFVVPQGSGTFVPTDAVQGPEPYGTFLDAPSVNYTPPTAYSPPPEPDTLPGPQSGAAASSAGWW